MKGFLKGFFGVSVMMCLSGGGYVAAKPANTDLPPSDIHISPLDWGKVSTSQLDVTPFIQVDKIIQEHSVEKRGFVTVPLDYYDPQGAKIDIFFRLMPSKGASLANDKKPILVVMNGGPGMPSSGYRSIDFDYVTGKGRNRYDELDKYFRILAVDQRGTGFSAPLDLDNPSLSPQIIATYFDSNEHARDHVAVIAEVVSENEPFFMLARSYGGHIGFQYIALGNHVPQPAGIILSSAIQPDMDGRTIFSKRRQKQRDLQETLLIERPGIDKKLNRLRAHLQQLQIDPNLINTLWFSLGAGDNWEQHFEEKIDSLLAQTDKHVLLDSFEAGTVNLLNYVLSSAALIPGYTDKSLTKVTSKDVPFADWMLDENWVLNQIGNDDDWRQYFIAAVDANPPPATAFPNVAMFKDLMASQQVLFTFGEHDAFLEPTHQLEAAKRFFVPGHVSFQMFNGGHGAAFSKEGAKFVDEWAQERLKM